MHDQRLRQQNRWHLEKHQLQTCIIANPFATTSSTETQIKHNRIFVEKPVMWLNKALLRFTVNQAVNLICFRQHVCATLFESDMFESLKWLTACACLLLQDASIGKIKGNCQIPVFEFWLLGMKDFLQRYQAV